MLGSSVSPLLPSPTRGGGRSFPPGGYSQILLSPASRTYRRVGYPENQWIRKIPLFGLTWCRPPGRKNPQRIRIKPLGRLMARRGMLTLDQLRTLVEDGTIDTVLVAITDMQGRLQGK